MSKRPYFRTGYGKQRVSGFETLLKSARHNYYQMFSRMWDNSSWRKFVFVRSEIFGLFVNTLTGEYQYSSRNVQNFPHQIQTQLSQKRKAFSLIFIAFFKCTKSLEHFEEKDEPSCLRILEVIESKGNGYLNV